MDQGEEDDDPIAKLLKSNVNIFKEKDLILKPGRLNFTKLINANAGHYH